MAEFQKVGDEQGLSKGPRNYDRSRFSGGKHQVVGDQVAMSSKPVPMQSGEKHIKGGQFQQVGTHVGLSRNPHKGWESYKTPVSDRASFQSVMPGFSGKGPARGKKSK